MVFHTINIDGYIEADVSREISLNHINSSILRSEIQSNSDNQADEIHEQNVKEIVRLLTIGEL